MFPDVPGLIEKYLPKDIATLIQVGSNDGMTGDPIYLLLSKYKNWRAIFIEPVPYLFERLKQNYRNERRFTFENVAVNEGTEQTFYFVNPTAIHSLPELPYWYDQLGSFDRENITRHLDGVLEPYIQEMRIKGLKIGELIKRHHVKTIDLLHIDAEGYDWKILKQFDIVKYRPTIILFEHKHLSTQEREESIKYVKNDYYILKYGSDLLNIRKDVLGMPDLILLKMRKKLEK